jgi:nuclear cap-binding protein subunit 2
MSLTLDYFGQSRKRKFDRDRDDRDDREGSPEAAPEDPLKDATTLYVGNLYVNWGCH